MVGKRLSLFAHCLALLAIGVLTLMPGLHAQARGAHSDSPLSLVCAQPGETPSATIGQELADLLNSKAPANPELPDDCKFCHLAFGHLIAAPATLITFWPLPEVSVTRTGRVALSGRPRGPPLGARAPPRLT